ncbi:MAG TPA: EamA family transporter [Vitreimonas sp.]|nr:EamA family transporter [Vitreimonas sp.]
MTLLLAYLFYFFAATVMPLQRRWLAINRDGEEGGQIDFAFKVMSIIVVLGMSLPLIEPFEIRGNIFILGALAGLCGVFGAGFWICSYVAQKHVDAGVTTIVSNIYTPITIVLASLTLNERLTLTQGVGTILLLIAIILISKKHHLGRLQFDKYFLMMVASGLMLGVLLTAERALQKMTGFSAGTLLSWWAQWAGLGIMALITKNKSRHTATDTLITGGVRFLSALSWVSLIYIVGNLSLVSAIGTFKIVLIFIAAALFLNEREDLSRKMIGSVIAMIGLLLMK